jgi:hypothetical protein
VRNTNSTTPNKKLKIEKHELYYLKQKTKDLKARTLTPQTKKLKIEKHELYYLKQKTKD